MAVCAFAKHLLLRQALNRYSLCGDLYMQNGDPQNHDCFWISDLWLCSERSRADSGNQHCQSPRSVLMYFNNQFSDLLALLSFQELKVVSRPQNDGTGRRQERRLSHCLDPWPCQMEQGVGPRGAHAVRRAAAVRGAAAQRRRRMRLPEAFPFPRTLLLYIIISYPNLCL